MGTLITVPIINHLLIFGFCPDDLVEYKKDKFDFQLYTSEFLDSLWYEKFRCYNYGRSKSGMRLLGYNKDLRDLHHSRCKWHNIQRGFVVVGDVSFQSCSYVARYLLKKQTRSENDLELFDNEFLGVSNGIGFRWLQDNYKTVFANGSVNYVHNGEIKQCPIPKYYIEKLKEIDEDMYNKIKKESYVYMQKKVENFELELMKLSDKQSNEKALRKKTYERFKRSLDNEKDLCSL